MTTRKYKESRVKVEEYMKSSKVRALRAHLDGWANDYGVPQDAQVDEEHILSVILYCDYTLICTKMSETFRRLSVGFLSWLHYIRFVSIYADQHRRQSSSILR